MQARCFISRPGTYFFSQHTREPININYLPGRADLFAGNPLTAHIQRNLSAIPQNVSEHPNLPRVPRCRLQAWQGKGCPWKWKWCWRGRSKLSPARAADFRYRPFVP
jgi:hypothetical protein